GLAYLVQRTDCVMCFMLDLLIEFRFEGGHAAVALAARTRMPGHAVATTPSPSPCSRRRWLAWRRRAAPRRARLQARHRCGAEAVRSSRQPQLALTASLRRLQPAAAARSHTPKAPVALPA